MELVLGLLDCELEPSKIESILSLSGAKRNTVAFEFAADRSLEMVQILKSLRAGNDTGYDMFVMALTARSLKWVEQLINAGFNLQQAIDDVPSYISVLADIDHQGLAQKLKGLNYVITPRRIEQAETEAGKQALKALMTTANNQG
jgi:histidyl-tRNA synthetase